MSKGSSRFDYFVFFSNRSSMIIEIFGS